MSELLIFPVSYNFDNRGSFVLNHPSMGKISNGQFEVDRKHFAFENNFKNST
ncbi:hypothetical protein [Flavobacterium sp. XS2P39]|uniref:hypothetical protein n=1 Tax=Flavobacterium sp. XS2P39 TaxID=3401725 RepID=UPI003AAE35FE